MSVKLSDVLTSKQKVAYEYLTDDCTIETVYGGAAGGGKSFLGCLWLFNNCFLYPGSRWLMGRSVSKTLKETTLATFFDIGTKFRWKPLYDYKEQKSKVIFANGSEILLKDLYQYPSDPNFDSLGSLEITGAFIDECNQIVSTARDVVKSRIRYKLGEFGLQPKLLMTCNPSKNWVYSDFYKPSIDGHLVTDRAFVQALVTDNPHIPISYINSLKSMKNKALKERLLHGNWNYDDDPAALIPYDVIIDSFRNDHVQPDTNNRYMTVDVAMYGSDMFRCAVWSGFVMIDMLTMAKSGGKEVIDAIQALRVKHQIRPSNVVYDADGVGAFVGGSGGFITGAKAFHGGSSPIKKGDESEKNYENLKTQCAYHFAKRMNEGGYWFKSVTSEIEKQTAIEELEQLKTKDADKDGKLRIKRKEDMKQDIGRSPDFLDICLMREYFELGSNYELNFL